MTMNQKISGRIVVLMANHMKATGADEGESLKWAFDKVLGNGAYMALASDIYDDLNGGN